MLDDPVAAAHDGELADRDRGPVRAGAHRGSRRPDAQSRPAARLPRRRAARTRHACPAAIGAVSQQALAAAVRNPRSGPGEPSTPPTIVIISLSPRPSAAGCRRLLERRRVAPGAGGAVQPRPLQVGALGGLDVLRPAAPRRRARAPGAPARTRTRAARGAGRAGSSRPDGPSRPRRTARPRGSRSPAPRRGRAGRGTSSVRSATSSTPARSLAS